MEMKEAWQVGLDVESQVLPLLSPVRQLLYVDAFHDDDVMAVTDVIAEAADAGLDVPASLIADIRDAILPQTGTSDYKLLSKSLEKLETLATRKNLARELVPA